MTRGRARARCRDAVAVAVALAALAIAGCSDDDEGAGGPAQDAPKEVRTTRVEVVSGLGKKGSFDPAVLYDRLSPGVVTVLSIFEGGGESLLRGGRDYEEGGQG